MAQLPTLDSLGGRPAPQPAAAVTEIRPGAVESAVANAGDAINAIDNVMTKTRRTLQLSEAIGKATEQLGEKAIAYQRDQDFRTAPTRFKADAKTIGETVAAGIDDQFVRQLFAERYTPLAVAQQLHVTQSAAKQEIDYGQATLKESLGQMATGMANAEDGFLKKSYEDMAKTAIGEMRGTGVISDVQALGMKQHFYQSYYAAKRGTDPVAALVDLTENRDQLDPLAAAQMQQHLFVAAEPVLANRLVKAMPFSLTSVTPSATAETMENLRDAIVKRESGGNPNAVSPQGARGAAQIMQGTFDQYKQPGESFDNEADRRKAADRKLADDWTYFKGDVKKVAAAYIGGRGAVRDDGTIRDDVKDALGTTPAAYAAQVTQLMGAVRQSVINQAIVGPNGAFEEAIRNPEKPTGDPVVDALPLDQKIRVLQQARTQAQQGQAQVRGAMTATLADVKAMYRDGKDPTNVPTADQIILAMGPVDGMREATQVQQARQYGQDVKTVSTMSRGEQYEFLQKRASELPDGAGYADAKRYLDATGEAVAQVQKQQDQNPSGFVLQNNPATRTLFDAMNGSKEPENRAMAAQAYAASTLAEQTRLGIPRQSILPPQMVDTISQQFNHPGNDAAASIAGLGDQWGPYYKTVMRELRKSIPPGAVVIGLGIKQEAAQLLSEGLKLKPEQLQAGFQDTDIKSLTDAITKKFEPMRPTVAYQTGGVETYDNYVDSAKTLALMMMQKGTKMQDAVDKAYDGMLDFKYAFNNNLRVPKEALGPGVTVPDIQAGGKALVIDIAEKGSLALPGPIPTGMRVEDALADWRKTVKSSGFWITSPGDGSATLHYHSAMGAQEVLDAAGHPIVRTWKEMASTNTERLPTFMDNEATSTAASRATQMRGGPGVGGR